MHEMLCRTIDEGALFYFKIRRRISVPITDELRKETIELADRFHRFVADGKTPAAVYSKKCESCSFIDECFPESAGKNKSAVDYIRRRLRQDVAGIDE